MFGKKKISTYLLIRILLLLFLSLFAITLFVVYEDTSVYRAEIALKKAEILTRQKSLVKEEVELAVFYAERLYQHCVKRNEDITICKKDVVSMLAARTFSGDNYLFGFTLKGLELFAAGKEFDYLDISNLKNADSRNAIKLIMESAKNKPDGAFVSYRWPKSADYRSDPEKTLKDALHDTAKVDAYAKISFVKTIAPFGWIVGAGLYLDDFADLMLDAKTKVRQKIWTDIAVVSILYLFVFLFFLAFLHLFSAHLEGSLDLFDVYCHNPSKIIDTSGIVFTEFQYIAESINRTVVWRNSTEKILNNYAEILEKKVEKRTAVIKKQATRLQNQNYLLEEQNRKITEEIRYKNDFFANMSHELRTPLNAIISLSHALLIQTKDRYTETEQQYLEIIEKNGKALLTEINEILDVTRFEARKGKIEYQMVVLSSVIATIQSNFAATIENKQIDFRVTISPQTPPIFTDTTLLTYILQNIIGNAFKFTEKGFIAISSQYADNTVYIAIEDSGVGIPDDQLEKIFERFKQVDSALSKKYAGMGLGLAIVEKAATLIGATITVQSKVGKGSVFTIIIPVNTKGDER